MEMKKVSLQELKKIELNILKYIDDICRQNNIKYFAISGTLLGAIRHKGFIPWDDDIDIALTRENYEKLINILLNTEDSRYKLLINSTNKNYAYPYAKLCDTYTVLKEKAIRNTDEVGVYIDIFYYDPLPRNAKVVHSQFKKVKFFINHVIGIVNSKNDKNMNKIKKTFRNIVYFLIVNLFGKARIIKKYNNLNKKYKKQEAFYAISVWPCYDESHEIQKWDNIIETIDYRFEDMNIMIPRNYDEVLKIQFGNYMELPPIEKRIPHHNQEVFLKEEI